jgi:hypothetical protein
MLLTKLKTYGAVVLVAVVLGAWGLAYRAAGQDRPGGDRAAPRAETRPLSDLEILKREVAILKAQVELLQDQMRGLRNAPAEVKVRKDVADKYLGLNVVDRVAVTDKVTFKDKGAVTDKGGAMDKPAERAPAKDKIAVWEKVVERGPAPEGDALRQAEEALRRLRTAPDGAARQRAADALERALRSLRRARPNQPADRRNPSPQEE